MPSGQKRLRIEIYCDVRESENSGSVLRGLAGNVGQRDRGILLKQKDEEFDGQLLGIFTKTSVPARVAMRGRLSVEAAAPAPDASDSNRAKRATYTVLYQCRKQITQIVTSGRANVCTPPRAFE
jgi:hypothetical protein